MNIIFNADDFLTTKIIDNVYDNMVQLKQIFFDVLDREVLIDKPDISKGDYTVPYPDFINIIEHNINNFTQGGYFPEGMQLTVEWLGELADEQRISYIDVNRWFESLEMIEDLIYATGKRMLITGNFSTGHDKTRQVIRVVNNIYG